MKRPLSHRPVAEHTEPWRREGLIHAAQVYRAPAMSQTQRWGQGSFDEPVGQNVVNLELWGPRGGGV